MIITIIDKTTLFTNAFVHVWTNQDRTVHRGRQVRIPLPANDGPLGVVFGVYALLDGLPHTVGHCMLDASKLAPEQTITVPVLDHTCPQPKTGELRLHVRTTTTVTTPLPFTPRCRSLLAAAAEANTNTVWDRPYVPYLAPMHSPYYTNNVGLRLPSGAFLLSTGHHVAALEPLKTTLLCLGMTIDDFMVLSKDSLHAVARTLTMHAVQCVSYRSDRQYQPNRQYATDRWETSRTVGDCEDCSKEVYLQYHEWQRNASDHPLVVRMKQYLNLYDPVLVQTCVNVHQQYKNHIVAALVPKNVFQHALARTEHRETIPTLLLEGTNLVSPFYDENDTFYKHAVACMSPRSQHQGILDYVYGDGNTYGVPMKRWFQGRYIVRPVCKHTNDTMNAIRQAIAYDKPVQPVNDLPTIHTLRKPSNATHRNGYRCTAPNTKQTANIIKYKRHYYVDTPQNRYSPQVRHA